jgi:hypothetical protein
VSQSHLQTALNMAKSRPDFGVAVAAVDTYLLADAGIETVFIFEKGVDLPHFAVFDQEREAQFLF